ncbi:Nif11-like leader peptide family natural product precursor [Mesorhizobium tianshanense]|nr:Nif11-like leader peptide family natural product precursor [Mesorhizobium tianshanense]
MRTVRQRAKSGILRLVRRLLVRGTIIRSPMRARWIVANIEQRQELAMPRTDLERFVNDLGKKGSLLERLKQRAGGLASIVAIGKSLDYNITLEEVKSYI